MALKPQGDGLQGDNERVVAENCIKICKEIFWIKSNDNFSTKIKENKFTIYL